MEILTSAQMSAADSYTIKTIGIPSAVLMENAAAAFVSILTEKYSDLTSAAVVAGSGNNGGDGLAVARLLTNMGIHTDIFLSCPPEKLKGDALLNFNVLTNYPVNIYEITADEIPTFENYSVVIDALFGTGLSRPVSGIYEEIINSINLTAEIIASVDIPSGLSGDSWQVEGTAIDADLTVTFARPKFPHVLFPARKLCGETVIADISIPDFAVDQAGSSVYLLTTDNLPPVAPREPDSHKGHFGHAVIAGGSRGKAGAAMMASLSCAKTGAGLTTLAVPGGLIDSVEGRNPEIMTLPLGEDIFFDHTGARPLSEFLENKTVAAIGPGIGTNEGTSVFLDFVVKNTELPLVIDADGINLLHKNHLKFLKNRCVITPHMGEFARLLGITTEEAMNDRINLARKFADDHGIIVVQKSADTVIAIPGGTVFIDITGTPALSKGGSGDCLTGMIASFAAQGYDLDFAALLGSYTLGRTAEIVSEKMNERSVMTTDIINHIADTLDELEKNS